MAQNQNHFPICKNDGKKWKMCACKVQYSSGEITECFLKCKKYI